MQTVAWWESRFLGAWQYEYNLYNPKSISGDSWDIYDLAYPINSNYMMFKVTGNTQYLDRGLLYTDNVIARATISSSIPTSQFKDSYLTWANHSHPGIGDDGEEYPLFESYGWRYVTALLYAMKQNTTVYNNPTYRAKYDSILDFTERNIWEKWYTRSVNSYLYRANTHMASHWAMIGMYLSLMTTNETKRAQYNTVWKNIAYNGMPNYSGASIQGQLRTNPTNSNAYWWNDLWNDFSRPGSDVSHGNAVAAFMIESYDLGLYWTASDMAKMVSLVRDVILDDTTNYPNYLDNTGAGNGWIIDGFAQLGRYDSALQAKIETHDVAQGTALYGAGALNAKILSSGVGAGPVGWWKFDETSGTTAVDASGNNHPGTVFGATWTSGKVGNALSFNGTSNFVDFGDNLDLIGSDLTISVWVKPAVLKDFAGFVDKLSSDGNYRLTGSANGSVTYGVRNSAGAYESLDTAPGKLTIGTWTHLVVTHSNASNQATLYINGVAAETKAMTVARADTTTSLQAGYTSNNGIYYSGDLDDIRIYNRTLTPSDVSALYQESTIVAPVVTNVSVTEITATSARINWSVSPPATGQIAYGQTSSYGSLTTNEPGFLAAHSQTISGLTPNQSCHYNIMGTTANGGTVAPVDRRLMRWFDGVELLDADWLLEGEKVYLHGRVLTVWTIVRRAHSLASDNIYDEAAVRAIVEGNR